MYNKIIFSFFLSAVIMSVDAQSSVEVKIWKNVEAVNKAIFVVRDSIVLEQLINSDVNYGHSNGNVEDKITLIKKALANKSTYENVETEKVSIKIAGNIAIARHIISAKEINGEGKSSSLKLNVLQVWQKLYGKWKLIARQAGKIVTN